MHKLSSEQQQWVDEVFASLSLEERVAQLLLPSCGSAEQAEPVYELMKDVPIGGIFVWTGTKEHHKEHIGKLQAAARIPLVVAADLECGAGHIIKGATTFPDPLAVGAADDDELAYLMGKAAALEGRSVGVHWTFAPICDVNVNPDNPIANTRSLGDDPERVGRLAAAMGRGLQDHGIAACPKHFPGDGVDDIDQHTATSINSLSMEDWERISGKAFRMAYDDGAWSTMIGHIGLPAWDPETDDRGAYRPATVNKRIVTDLLRKKLGFDGLIVTDDMNMGGVTGYMTRAEGIVESVKAGCDVVLFPEVLEDYQRLLEAAKSGEITKERLDDAVRRILTFKARLGLHKGDLVGRDPTDEEKAEFARASEAIAKKAVCKVRDVRSQLPLNDLKPGARVLTVTLSHDGIELPEVDAELTKRGLVVEHLKNPDDMEFGKKSKAYDAIFLNFGYKACWTINSVRSVGGHNKIFFKSFYNEHPRTICTSFGSPYNLRMFSTLPNYTNVHSDCPQSQRAAVAMWFGELAGDGTSPVDNLTRTF